MNTQDLSRYLDISVDRVEAIAADLGIAVTEGFIFGDEQVEQIEAVALHMAERGIADPAVAIAALENFVTLANLAQQLSCPLALLVGIAEALSITSETVTTQQADNITAIYRNLATQQFSSPAEVGLTIAQLAQELDVSSERVEAIAEELGYPTTSSVEFNDEQVEQIVAVAQFMVEKSLTSDSPRWTQPIGS